MSIFSENATRVLANINSGAQYTLIMDSEFVEHGGGYFCVILCVLQIAQSREKRKG
jgi:hypothetical protein